MKALITGASIAGFMPGPLMAMLSIKQIKNKYCYAKFSYKPEAYFCMLRIYN